MAVQLKVRPVAVVLLRRQSTFSSSFSSSSEGSSGDGGDAPGTSSPPSHSPFSDIKDHLKSPYPPPRRISDHHPPPPPPPPPPVSPSFEEIRKRLATYRSSPSHPTPPPLSPPSLSFQDILKNSTLSKPGDNQFSFETIRESLRQLRSDQSRPSQGFRSRLFQDGGSSGRSRGPPSSILGRDSDPPLPDSIFAKELQERKGDSEGEGEKKALKTEFLRMYSPEELGEKLRQLRPEHASRGGNDWFSLQELNERLAKLRKKEEESQSRMGGVWFGDLRECLEKLRDGDRSKKTSAITFSLINSISSRTTQTFMLKPPQEHLLENYFHPDHMSSAEKMKIELQRVRDEFKMSESDCGSTRVQVAQLTTKIKHLSHTLHKKDKHSRKGLQDMVQKRKKLLKYLRRTDWDSYCMVLSKLGLRDVPGYKLTRYKA